MFSLNKFFFILIIPIVLLSEEFVKPKSIYLSSELPNKQLYVNQVFPIDFKIIVANENIEKFYSIFLAGHNIEVINSKANWKQIDKYTYSNRYYFKIKDKSGQTPQFKFFFTLKNGDKEEEIIDGVSLNALTLNKRKDFSNVIATNLEIKNYKTTKYDDKSNILVLEIDANESNLENFWLRFEKQGIDSIEQKLPITKIFYYALISQKIDTLNFEYFNTKTNKFAQINLPIIIEDDKTVNQSDLDPQDTNLKLYKIVALSVVLAIFIILFAIKKGKFNLFVIILLCAILIYDLIPNKIVKISKDCKISLLPTKNSTVFRVLNQEMNVELLDYQNEYLKILLPDNSIGWVHEDCNL
ncbi:MAG: SH3 domain-containing protein [Campylobacterales bacterium]|nr:SH3 domain-containing protein [Campylobacterales bacterium]